jgi:hypothetical protein
MVSPASGDRSEAVPPIPIFLGNNLHAQETRNLRNFLENPLHSAAMKHRGQGENHRA